jgi:tetratricopeptide (TPR) repeat protein
MITRIFMLVAGVLSLSAELSHVGGQQATPVAQVEGGAPVPLYETLGTHGRGVTTARPVAQAYFDQGMRLAYAFAMPEARASFQAAIEHDPDCASCHWGLAWSLGPYVNGAMDSIAGLRAYEHAQEAKRLAANATGVERALIEAMGERYAPVPTRQNRAALDSAYAIAMGEAARRFPDDLDVAALHAESMMVLRPWNYWTRAGEPHPGVETLLTVLEGILARDLAHPGACHLYIHAVEASLEPGRAAPCADLLVHAMPGASHMPHMPSHTYMRIGRYGDAVRVNQLARIADQQAEHGEATATYAGHNLQMLLFAAVYDGQSGVAIQAARDLARLAPGSFQLPLVLARFGRWQEIMELPAPSGGTPLAMWNYARGMAHLRNGQIPAARMNLAGLEEFRTAITAHYGRQIVGLAAATLSAELDARAGRFEDAIRTLEAARVIETDSLGYSEPEDWLVPLRQVMGAILLNAELPAEAEIAYRGELEAHPENGWSLFGLHLALTAQGRHEEARSVLERFERAWQRADVHLRASRF